MLKVDPHPDYPPEEGRYLRGNDRSPVVVVVVLNHAEDKIPREIERLVRVGVEAGAALSGTVQTENIGFEKIICNVIANPNIRWAVLTGPESEGHLSGEAPAESAGQPELPPAAQRLQLSFEYFYDPGCKGCEIFLVRQMIALQQELQIRLRVTRRDIGKPEVYQLYTRKLVVLGMEERAYPAVVFADVVLQGDEEIEREFKKVLRRHLDSQRDSSNP